MKSRWQGATVGRRICLLDRWPNDCLLEPMAERAADLHAVRPATAVPRRRLAPVLLLASVALALVSLAPAPAAAAAGKWVVKGGGFGHGVGMSQWGAYGMALRGESYEEILRHFYRGVELRPYPSR